MWNEANLFEYGEHYALVLLEQQDTDNDDNDDDLSLLDYNGTIPRFVIQSSFTEDRIRRRLRMLRKIKSFYAISNQIDFVVEGISWTDGISQEMIRTFQFYEIMNRRYESIGQEWARNWGTAIFLDLAPDTSVHVHSVLQAPVTTQLFEHFVFGNKMLQQRPMVVQVATSLACILRNGQNVKIEEFEIGSESMSVLSDALVTLADSSSGRPKALDMIQIGFRNDEESSDRRTVEQALADGFAQNTTLTAFRMIDGYSRDDTAAIIIRSLMGHPALKKLSLTSISFGEATSTAICDLLAFPTCKLSSLGFCDPYRPRAGYTAFDLERFIERLPAINTSLERLVLAFDQHPIIDDDSANRLLQRLHRFPNLKLLGLCSNLISDWVHLARDVTMTTPPSCLRELTLLSNRLAHGGPPEDKHRTSQAILHLLDIFPALAILRTSLTRSLKHQELEPIVEERLDLNRCAGMLLHGASIPLSGWTVVLNKVIRDKILTPSRRSNVFYHMLHGAVFLGRGSFVFETDHPSKRKKSTVKNTPSSQTKKKHAVDHLSM